MNSVVDLPDVRFRGFWVLKIMLKLTIFRMSQGSNIIVGGGKGSHVGGALGNEERYRLSPVVLGLYDWRRKGMVYPAPS